MPAPCTVRAAEPVDAWLARRAALISPPSADTPADSDPAPRLTVTTVRRLYPALSGARAATALSDTHVVLSHAVRPTATPSDWPACPIPAPCTVMLADPVAAPLALVIALSDAVSADTAHVTLADRIPDVNVTRLLPASPCPAQHETAVSDAHVVASHADFPMPADMVDAIPPIPAP